jgi:hypothetical protein
MTTTGGLLPPYLTSFPYFLPFFAFFAGAFFTAFFVAPQPFAPHAISRHPLSSQKIIISKSTINVNNLYRKQSRFH